MYIDINVLQTVPASNINRDETGSPKTVIYGGVTRARVSSPGSGLFAKPLVKKVRTLTGLKDCGLSSAQFC